DMMASELNKMGAQVEVTDTAAVVRGPTPLRGAKVTAHDLRTGVALVLAGLAARGETIVSPGYLIDRGPASLAARLTALGADIIEEEVRYARTRITGFSPIALTIASPAWSTATPCGLSSDIRVAIRLSGTMPLPPPAMQ